MYRYLNHSNAWICSFFKNNRLQLDGHLDAHFTYIPTHIEFILLELLKNSMAYVVNSCTCLYVTLQKRSTSITSLFVGWFFWVCALPYRATIRQHRNEATLPPIRITFSKGDQNVVIRVSDEGMVPIAYCFYSLAYYMYVCIYVFTHLTPLQNLVV